VVPLKDGLSYRTLIISRIFFLLMPLIIELKKSFKNVTIFPLFKLFG
jgi:hypothetical protein